MNLTESLELYHKYQMSGMQENQIRAIFEGLDVRDKDVITNKDLQLAMDEIRHEFRISMALLNKDFQYLKWMVGGIAMLTAFPILKGLIS